MQLSAVYSEPAGMPGVESAHAQRVLSSLNQQRASGAFCDAALTVGAGPVYLAHRNILACFSELFQQSSVPPGPRKEFCLQECPNEGLELLLNFAYTGELKLDSGNLDKVHKAATSLCMPEALALCQRFKDTPADPGRLKRKRGRPRKTSLHGPVKEEAPMPVAKDDASLESATASSSLAATAAPFNTTGATTTTRSGRVVKGPRRLVPDESPNGDVMSTETPNSILEKESGEVENSAPDQPAAEAKVTELHIDLKENRRTQEIGGPEEEDESGASEGSDDEYVPVADASPSALNASAARKRKAQRKAGKPKAGEALEEESRKESVQCPICDKTFKSKYYLKVHNRRHTGERPFGCHKCGKRYFRKENLLIHEIRDCARAQTYSCLTCASTFNGKEELRLHIVSHTGEMPHKCSTCSEQFMHKKNLTLHMMKVHGYPKPHGCPQCPKTFLTRTELRVHEAAKHRGEKPFVCEECGHRASSRNGLQMHIKAIHRNERPFVCSFCSHAFSQKNNLNMHLRIHSGEKPYQCHLCGKTFRTQASLDKHHRTHTGERPFTCDVCEQRFTEKGALVRHKASKHEEGRPHSCHICNKTFKAREQLRVHLRRHKGMRKFECIDCGYKFTRQAHLRRHIQIHKRTENYNPRQRKLRNVIVQDADGGSDEHKAAGAAEASPTTQDAGYSTVVGHEAANPEAASPGSGLGSSCIMRVVIESSGGAMEGVMSAESLGQVEAVESFSVPEVLQQAQLVETYQSTINMGGIDENISKSKT